MPFCIHSDTRKCNYFCIIAREEQKSHKRKAILSISLYIIVHIFPFQLYKGALPMFQCCTKHTLMRTNLSQSQLSYIKPELETII